MAEEKFKKIRTSVFRAAFVHVFEPHMAPGAKEAKFSVVMLFQKDDPILKELKAAAQAAAKEKWGDKIPPGLKSPFRSGAEKSHLDGFGPDVVFITATTKQKPGLVDQRLQPIENSQEFYSGCYARATVNAFAYDTAGNKGVSFGLQNLQKVRDGAPFGRTRATDDFDAVESGEEGSGDAAPAAKSGDSLFD